MGSMRQTTDEHNSSRSDRETEERQIWRMTLKHSIEHGEHATMYDNLMRSESEQQAWWHWLIAGDVEQVSVGGYRGIKGGAA